MKQEKPPEKIARELSLAFTRMRRELDRVELMAAALTGFSTPIPDYEPAFQDLMLPQQSREQLGHGWNRLVPER